MSSSTRSHQDVQIEEDPRFQRREWRVQRVAWLAFALIIVAALAGVFGRGPLSKASVSGAGLRLHYERFARCRTPQTLTIQLTADDADAEQHVIWISRDYLQGMEIERITPEPASERLAPGRIEFHFEQASGGAATATADARSAETSRTITFSLLATARGTRSGALGLNDGPPIEFWQFIMP
jgi:hypothetical protein